MGHQSFLHPTTTNQQQRRPQGWGAEILSHHRLAHHQVAIPPPPGRCTRLSLLRGRGFKPPPLTPPSQLTSPVGLPETKRPSPLKILYPPPTSQQPSHQPPSGNHPKPNYEHKNQISQQPYQYRLIPISPTTKPSIGAAATICNKTILPKILRIANNKNLSRYLFKGLCFYLNRQIGERNVGNHCQSLDETSNSYYPLSFCTLWDSLCVFWFVMICSYPDNVSSRVQ